MSRTTVSRTIRAPVAMVFDTIAEIERYSQAVPHIVDVEFLTDVRVGVGAKFRETRLMGKRRASTVLEVVDYERPDRIRLVSDEGGTIWDSLFTVRPSASRGGGCELKLTMDAKPHTWLARLMTPLIRGMVRRAIEQDMDAVMNWCEREASLGSGDDAKTATVSEPRRAERRG